MKTVRDFSINKKGKRLLLIAIRMSVIAIVLILLNLFTGQIKNGRQFQLISFAEENPGGICAQPARRLSRDLVQNGINGDVAGDGKADAVNRLDLLDALGQRHDDFLAENGETDDEGRN